jgi:NTP pyrophosphatase (non-canonical NTP hydrolase)
MSDRLDELQQRHQAFIEKRDWEEFHTPKSLAMAISIEASELMELFQWHDNLPAEEYDSDPDIQREVEEELADIMIYSLSMAAELGVDIEQAIERKLKDNEHRFDREQSEKIRDELLQWQNSNYK